MTKRGMNLEVVLYTTHCPKCSILEKKLHAKNVEYTEVCDVDKIISMGIDTVPILSVDGVMKNFSEANKWVNEIGA